jgi:hypothetical protein
MVRWPNPTILPMSWDMTNEHLEQSMARVARPPRSAAADRALAEAEARRAKSMKSQRATPEINGRQGLDPVRFGDWEVRGIACDF